MAQWQIEPVELKVTRVVVLVTACSLFSGCEPLPPENGSQICVQATGFIARNSIELQPPRDWNRLMASASRLVYLDNACGGLITDSKEVLCASLAEAIDTFANNPQVPEGSNRDYALATGQQTYEQGGCAAVSTTRE